MKAKWIWLALAGGVAAVHGEVDWLPAGLPALPMDGEALCVREYLTPEQGAAVLRAASERFTERKSWENYAALVRRKIQEGAGLMPWPARTPLNARVTVRRVHDGYSVENVALETLPGVWACGNLYRPLHTTGRRPAILTTHGHTPAVATEADWTKHGRFKEDVQRRAATLARMGAVVLTIDMFGYGDSLTQFGAEAHRRPLAMTMQVWNAIRAIDFLSGRDDVDPARIAMTGESGGGTQTFLVAALDERVAVSVPVVMVSSYFFGGCPCESGRPVHRTAEHFVNNAMIAALTAPRPMLLVSDGGDWTRFTPEVEFPYVRGVYRLFDAESAVENVHLPREGHDYGPSKRAAVYRFLSDRLGLAGGLENGADGTNEDRVTLESPEAMRMWAGAEELPAGACRTVEAAEAALRALQREKERR